MALQAGARRSVESPYMVDIPLEPSTDIKQAGGIVISGGVKYRRLCRKLRQTHHIPEASGIDSYCFNWFDFFLPVWMGWGRAKRDTLPKAAMNFWSTTTTIWLCGTKSINRKTTLFQ